MLIAKLIVADRRVRCRVLWDSGFYVVIDAQTGFGMGRSIVVGSVMGNTSSGGGVDTARQLELSF